MPTVLRSDALLAWRHQQLQDGGNPSDLDWLLDLAGGVRWPLLQQLRLRPDQSVTLKCSLPELEELWSQHRLHHTPLQYLVGVCPWRDLELQVGPGVLIPRQETELLVELALERARGGEGAPYSPWADLGTGSGCIAVAMARALPTSRGYAVDASEAALQQAAINLERHQLGDQVSLLHGSWWEPLQTHWGQLHLVVSNPPYIPTAVWRDLEPVVHIHEPSLALDGGSDGLDAIRTIASGAGQALAPGGWLFMEHHHDQSQAVGELLAEVGLVNLQSHADLEGKLRFASAQRTSHV
jgi:release factor glutamine methyltransferase